MNLSGTIIDKIEEEKKKTMEAEAKARFGKIEATSKELIDLLKSKELMHGDAIMAIKLVAQRLNEIANAKIFTGE